MDTLPVLALNWWLNRRCFLNKARLHQNAIRIPLTVPPAICSSDIYNYHEKKTSCPSASISAPYKSWALVGLLLGSQFHQTGSHYKSAETEIEFSAEFAYNWPGIVFFFLEYYKPVFQGYLKITETTAPGTVVHLDILSNWNKLCTRQPTPYGFFIVQTCFIPGIDRLYWAQANVIIESEITWAASVKNWIY